MCVPRCRCWSPIDKIFGNLALLRENLPFHPDDGGNVKQGAQWVLAKGGRELGIMFTGGSTSVKDAWLLMREADISAALEGERTSAGAGVAVLASTWWQATTAAAALAVEWNQGANANLSSAAMHCRFE